MWKTIKYVFIILFFLRGMVSFENNKVNKTFNKTVDKNDNLVLLHAKDLFNDFMSGSMSCHGSHSSHSSHESHRSHSSHRSHYSG